MWINTTIRRVNVILIISKILLPVVSLNSAGLGGGVFDTFGDINSVIQI